MLVALGLWLWRAGCLPQERDLVWRVPVDRASIRSVEIQIWSPEGEMLKREQFFFPQGPGQEITQSLALPEGNYQAQVFILREGRPTPRVARQPLSIGRQERYELDLPGG